MPWLRPQLSAGPLLTWPLCVKTGSVFTGTFTVSCWRDPEEFGSDSEACWHLVRCCASCFTPPPQPHVNQKGTHLPVNTAAVISSRSSLLWNDFSFLCPGCLKIPCNDENIVKLWEGLFRLSFGGRGGWLEMMPERSGVRRQLLLTSVSLLTHHFRLPYVGLASKIEVTLAADGNLVHSEVKDMYMGHVCML